MGRLQLQERRPQWRASVEPKWDAWGAARQAASAERRAHGRHLRPYGVRIDRLAGRGVTAHDPCGPGGFSVRDRAGRHMRHFRRLRSAGAASITALGRTPEAAAISSPLTGWRRRGNDRRSNSTFWGRGRRHVPSYGGTRSGACAAGGVGAKPEPNLSGRRGGRRRDRRRQHRLGRRRCWFRQPPAPAPPEFPGA